MKIKEVDCRKCAKCTGDSCRVYGSDAEVAVKLCAYDNFIQYTPRSKK